MQVVEGGHLDKISIFAPSIMRDQLVAREYCDKKRAPDVRQGFNWWKEKEEDPPRLRSPISSVQIHTWFQSVLQMCLYADEVWIPSVFLGHTKFDTQVSFKDWFRAPPMRTIAVHDEYFSAWNAHTSDFRAFFEVITPLVRAGIIRIYNPAHIYWEDVSEPLLGEKRWMTESEIENSYPDLFVAEGLLFAKSLGVPYTATNLSEIEAINRSIPAGKRFFGIHEKAVQMTTRVSMPGLTLNAEDIVAARQDSEAFEAFRGILRRISRQMPEITSSPNFEAEVKLLENDTLAPALNDLADKISKSSLLSRNLKPNAISFGAGALASLMVEPNPATALAVGTLSTLGQIVLSELLEKQSLAPEARFISYLNYS